LLRDVDVLDKFMICIKPKGLFAKCLARRGSLADSDVSHRGEATDASISVETPNRVGS
jgi:hypothetical protein